jgi:Flp pilus assembly protein TadG
VIISSSQRLALYESIRGRLTRCRRDIRGVAAVEFAFIAPLAILLLYGEFVIETAMAINRKVVITGHSAADLIAQNAAVTSAQVSDILNASAQIAAPYPNSNMTIVVAELTTDAKNKTTVTWSQALNASALPTGSNFTLPNGVGTANTSLIYSTTTYSYIPTVGANLFASIPISYTYYINPRVSNSIPLTD